MIRTQLYLPEDLYAKAKATATLEGVSVSVVVRRCLSDGLRRPAKLSARGRKVKGKKLYDPLAGLVGKFGVPGGKRTNIAMHHNDIYDM